MDVRGYVAIDLGAESGRIIVGTLRGDSAVSPDVTRLELHEVHRFTHEPVHAADGLRWNIDHIWEQMLAGLRAAAGFGREQSIPIVSLGVDCWGVDYALLDSRGNLLAAPRCYRDPRHSQGHALLQQNPGFGRLFEITGIQEMPFNTLPQLAAARHAGDPELTCAAHLQLLPDYFHTRLSGRRCSELTIASTSQLLDAATGDWSPEVLSRVGLTGAQFESPVAPGTTLGTIDPQIAAATGLASSVRIVLPASHDTASAVVGVPAQSGSWAYISSGTWSLVGVERAAPILTPAARAAGFSNERGAFGTFRFQKNIIGLWLIQELRRDLERRGISMTYPELAQAAAGSQPFRTRINPFSGSLIAPGDFLVKLQMLARAAGDPEPCTPGEYARCCLESLAMAYRRTIEELESLTRAAAPLSTIHLVGGGTHNQLLNQLAANAIGKRVLAGPVEATAAGNVVMQMVADSKVRHLAAARSLIAQSFPTTQYSPTGVDAWNEAYRRFLSIAST